MQTAPTLPASMIGPSLIAPPIMIPPEPATRTKPAPLLLFGRDERGRPHGACFVGSAAAAVERAADLMDLYFIAAETDALRDLGAKLAKGRLFPASGKAFVPFCSAALYERLLAATGSPDAARPIKAATKPAEAGPGAGGKQGSGAGGSGAGDPPATRAGMKAPADWSQIGLGSLVLAQGDEDDNEGYYVAKVIATKAGDSFVLTWAEYPDLPEFARPRKTLALLHPEAAGAVG